MRSSALHPPVLVDITPLRSTSASPLRKQHDVLTLGQLLHKPKEVLGSDVLINESHSLFTMPTSHTPVSTRLKQNLASFSAADAHDKLVANIVDPWATPLVVDNIPP